MIQNLSAAQLQQLSELLSPSLVQPNEVPGNPFDPEIAQLLGLGGKQKVSASAPAPASATLPRNYIKVGSTGQVIDLDYAAPGGSRPGATSPVTGAKMEHDVFQHGPKVMARYQLPDGTFEVVTKVATLGEDNIPRSALRRTIEIPDYLNPAKVKELEFKKRQAELRNLENPKKASESNWKEVAGPGGKMFLLDTKSGTIRPAEVGGEQLQTRLSPTEQKADLEVKAQADAKRRLSGMIQDLGRTYDEAKELGGTVDPEAGALQNLKARAQASDFGQMVGGALGTKLQSKYDNIKNIRPLLLQEIRKATEMGARGLDSNVELQFYLEAATDPTRGLPANMEALRRLDEAYGLGMFGRPRTPGSAPQPSTSAAPLQEKGQIIFEARKAIQAGKSREAVLRRLEQLGVNPQEAGL